MSIQEKRTLTVVLSDAEMSVLEALSAQRSLTKVGVLRQALRLYQTIDTMQQRGEKLFFENERSRKKAELIII